MNDKEEINGNLQSGQKPNVNENSKSTKPKGDANQSQKVGNQGQDQSLPSEIKSITAADVINNNNDLEKSSLKVIWSIYIFDWLLPQYNLKYLSTHINDNIYFSDRCLQTSRMYLPRYA